jgi:chromosome segregation protein
MAKENSGTLIKEVILENFMSYEYARIPFKPGLNVVCGPNGSGKSSILLALAVALGQTYTERSRKLSDLVRRGKDLGRVSVVFDNSPRNGSRPISSVKSDTFVLSRYLNKDGTYWHEANFRTIQKGEVMRVLSRLAIDPDNMLIIMHQSMIDIFGAIDVRERLKMVEEAVGLREYRDKILDAREKLSHTLSEEESIKSLLEKATETLRYWEGEYGRFKRKKALTKRKAKLEVEYAWAKCIRQEDAVSNLRSKVRGLKDDLKEIEDDMTKGARKEKQLASKLKELEYDIDSSYQKLITLERMKAEAETKLKLVGGLEKSLKSVSAGFKGLLEELKTDLGAAKEGLADAEGKTKSTKSSLVKLKGESGKAHEGYINSRVRIAVLGLRKELLEGEISGSMSELRRAQRELEGLKEEAKKVGARVETERKPQEVLDEIRITNAQLMGLADVSPEVEKMYISYKDLLEDLQQKVEVAAANRRKALEELEVRRERWRSSLSKLLKEVRETYVGILSRVNAAGDVRVVNAHDIDEAGLELLVGFRGAEPQVLDAYTQSGGERTTSILCLLLALQQHIQSPIRAIDEFDIHMDPRNREVMMKQMLDLMKEEETQYIVITPGQLVGIEGIANVITVQNVAGASKVKVAA